jgi:glutathione S-transferase
VSAQRKLYDLAGADPALRFSPYCWRVKLALAHKSLGFETVAWRFTDKDAIAFSGQGKVPVLVDGAATFHDSQAIAEYLEASYPNEPSLFGEESTRALTMFVKTWAEDTLHPAIARVILPDVFAVLDPLDQPYFRRTREAAFGMSIEDVAARREVFLPALNLALAPLRRTLSAQPFIAGAGPLYADHIVFGALQWARKTSATPLWDLGGPIERWMAAVLDTYGIDPSPAML